MKKFVLDIAILLLLLLVMGFHFLPHILHEVLGLVLLGGAVWHLLLNRHWFSALFRGRYGKVRVLQTVMLWLLVISFFTVMVTGSIISSHVFRELWQGASLHRSIFVHQLHIASAYVMVILGGMHVGMHWTGLWQRLKRIPLLGRVEGHPMIRFWLLAAISWAGVAFSWLDQVGDRLMMKHIFGTLASRLPASLYFLLLLCFIGLYAILFYYVQKHLQDKAGKDLEEAEAWKDIL
ncbi:MAG: DUF4405 domain-containing protein [Selenomonadaceae bacterium]|nr:DUF4405 domain-containing protein [Selenomonadaceae bacterium]